METAVISNMTTVIDAAATERVGIPFGRYVLLERIASGGMGEIFLARQRGNTGLARLVAVKRILQHYTSDKNHVRMFFDEARLQSLLSDRHIVQIYDMGECDDHLFIAMEFVLGVSLRRLVHKIAESGLYLHPAHACDLAVQICRGLSYAHNVEDGTGRALSIVHRDVNPQNILVSYDGEVKIIDFGIAKSEMSELKTETGTLKGKLTYMSPEQARGERLDRRSDLFSTGICFYEMLAGKNPFERGNVILSLQAIESEEVPPITTVRKDVVGFDDILRRMLSKDADRRFDDASEVVQALVDRYAQGAFGEPAMPLGDFMLRVFHDEIQARLSRLEGFGVKMAVRRRPIGESARHAAPYAIDVELSDPSRKLRTAPGGGKTNPALLVSRVERTDLGPGSRSGDPVSISQSEIHDADTALALPSQERLSSSGGAPLVDVRGPMVAGTVTRTVQDAPDGEPITEPTHSGAHPIELVEKPPASRRALAAGVFVGVTLGVCAFVALAILPSVDDGDDAEGVAIAQGGDADSPGPRGAPPTDALLVDVKPSDPAPDDAQPDDAQPIDAQPDDAQPSDPAPDDAQPVDVKPDDAQPVDVKPEDKKPDDAQPTPGVVVASKPEDQKPEDKKPEDKKSVDKDLRGGRSSRNDPPKLATAKTNEKPVDKASDKTSNDKVSEKPADKTLTKATTTTTTTEPEVTGPKAKLSVRVSGGYALGGKGVSGGAGTITVDGGGRRFKVNASDGAGLAVTVDAVATESGVALSVSSEPWAIVRVDSLGKGRTPQRIVVSNGERAEIMLKSPSGGEVSLFVKAN